MDQRSGMEVHGPLGIISGFLAAEPPQLDHKPASVVPEGLAELPGDYGMSNCFHEIDEGTEEKLRAREGWCRHAGWNFNGRVWWDAQTGEFKEEVWHYGEPQEQIFSAPTLRELMEAVNDEWGYD